MKQIKNLQNEYKELATRLLENTNNADANRSKLTRKIKKMYDEGNKSVLSEIAGVDRGPKLDSFKEFGQIIKEVETIASDEEAHFYLQKIAESKGVFEYLIKKAFD